MSEISMMRIVLARDARVRVQWTLGVPASRVGVDFRNPAFGVKSAVHFRNPRGIRTGELTDQTLAERHPYHWTTGPTKIFISGLALRFGEIANPQGDSPVRIPLNLSDFG